LSQAAGEYERIDPSPTMQRYAARRCSMQETSTRNPIPEIAPWMHTNRTLRVSQTVETAIEARFKIAEMHKAAHDETLYHKQLEKS